MPTIDRFGAFRIFIPKKDHDSPHVHVELGDDSVKIGLFDEVTGEPFVMRVYGMRRPEVRQALHIVATNQGAYYEEWRKIYG